MVGSLWLTQPNQCGCLPAEIAYLNMSKENKICQFARHRKISLKHQVPLQWVILLVVLTNTAIKMPGMKVVLHCIVGDCRKTEPGVRGFPVMPSYERGPATHSSLLKPGKLDKGHLLLTFVLIAYIFTRHVTESKEMFLISFPSLGGFGELSCCQLRCTTFLSHMSLSHFCF